MRTVLLAGPLDWSGFVHAARALVHEAVDPADVRWCDRTDRRIGLFDDGPAIDARTLPDSQPLRLPASFVERARAAALHADPRRFELLYRLIRRLCGDRRLAQDALDPDRVELDSMADAVRREMHKTCAFARFRKVVAFDDEDSIRHVAWFEPEHHVVEAVAPFFARRISQMRWSILSPRVSVEWDLESLRFGPGADRADAPAHAADADEALWLAYYASIFNPARVKVAAMKKEMPLRYWKNLPEARLIETLLAEAPQRVQRMVEARGSERLRHRGSAVEARSRQRRETSDPPDPAASTASSEEPLDALARRAARCRACPIGAGATQTVWGEGAPNARLMLVGEQPGDREDLAGRPFVGPAGRLLRKAFEQLGWPVERLYLTDAVKHFKYLPRGKRRIHETASRREIEICSGWLEAEIAAVRPRALVALGATAARRLLGQPIALGANEGRWLERADGRPVLIVAHPAALLRRIDGDDEAACGRWVALLARAASYVEGETPDIKA